MRVRVAGAIVILVATICMIFWLNHSSESEVLLSPGVVLTPEWQRITCPHVFMTKAPWSEVLVEIPGFHVPDAGGQLLRDDGTSFRVDGYLITDDGKKVTLDQVGTLGFGGTAVVRLSTAALQWKQRDYRFRTLVLRSNMSVQAGKVIWMSYDPRATKDGVAFPRALK